MELIGYSCRHPDPPLRRVFLPLGPLTVLLGRNDAGKSSLLRAVERDLGGGHYDDADEDTSKLIGGVFFATVSDAELRSLVDTAENIRRRVRERPESYLGRRPPWGLRGWTIEHFGKVDMDEGDPVETWLRTLREKAPDTEGFASVLDEVADSRVVALEPAGHDEGQRVWNVSWCLPPFEELSDEIRGALESSKLLPFVARRERAEAKAAGKTYGWFTRGFYIPFHGDPTHLWVDGAPVVVAPIGQTRSAHLPRGLAVPTEFSSLRREVAHSVNDLVVAARYAPEVVRSEGDPLTAEQEAARTAPRNWLDSDGDAWRIHPDASAAAKFVAAAANRLLPGFARERYRIEVMLRPLELWVGDRGEALDLRLRVRREDAIVDDFPVERVADGLRLWVQLALLEACEQAARVGTVLYDVAGDWWSRAEHASHAYGSEIDSPDDIQREADFYWEQFEAMLNDLRDLDPDNPPWITGQLAKGLEEAGPEDWTRRLARHRRFFVVDEPERHLHPNLQRAAAAWLKETAEGRGAPCLVATHSTPFLGLPTEGHGPLYVYVTRDGDDARCESFDAGQLKTLDDIVTSLGFDRGELLTTVSLFLVVEGIHDVVVLERVFGELRAARIALLPMEGLSNYQAVLEADALWRYTTAQVGLTTDKFEREWLEKVIADPEQAKALRKSDAEQETKLLGKLIGIAQLNSKRIHLLGHRGADLIDVLDEQIVRQEFPKYPGHAEALRLWKAEVANGAKASQKKAFYETAFELPMRVESYIQLGDAHAAAGVKPAQLKAIVDDAVRLAVGQPALEALSTLPEHTEAE